MWEGRLGSGPPGARRSVLEDRAGSRSLADGAGEPKELSKDLSSQARAQAQGGLEKPQAPREAPDPRRAHS